MNLTRTQVEDAHRSAKAYLHHGFTPSDQLLMEDQAQTILDLSKDWLELDQALRPSSVELPVEFIAGWECQREACFQFTPFTECEKDESGRSLPPPWCPECGNPPRKSNQERPKTTLHERLLHPIHGEEPCPHCMCFGYHGSTCWGVANGLPEKPTPAHPVYFGPCVNDHLRRENPDVRL